MATLALTGARLLDGISPAIDDATLVVDGERIVEVGTGAPTGRSRGPSTSAGAL